MEVSWHFSGLASSLISTIFGSLGHPCPCPAPPIPLPLGASKPSHRNNTQATSPAATRSGANENKRSVQSSPLALPAKGEGAYALVLRFIVRRLRFFSGDSSNRNRRIAKQPTHRQLCSEKPAVIVHSRAARPVGDAPLPRIYCHILRPAIPLPQ